LFIPSIGRRVCNTIEKVKLLAAFVTIVALMAVALMPVDMALAQEVNPDRSLPHTVERGQTFNVIVTFTAPVDKFTAVGLTDFCPDGWNVTVDATWCTPTADTVLATDNRAEIGWFGEPGVGFDKDTSFSALYKVIVPDYACAGNYTFDGFLAYFIAASDHIFEDVTGDSEVDVPVCDTPLICCNPKSFSFSATHGGSNPADQTLKIWNSGVDTISWSLSDDAGWLSENPSSGSSTGEPDTVAVSVDIAGMSAGGYSANITITADEAINSPWTVPVSLHIGSSTPEISFDPESLSFTAGEGGSNPAPKRLDIWNSGVDRLYWSLSDDADWLSENPTNGSSVGERDTVVLSVDVTGMSDGAYSASITIASPGASNSPQTVPINLYVGVSPPPAQFTITSLDVTPERVPPGQPVTVSAQVTNTGGSGGSYTVNLTVNGQVEQTKTVPLAPEAMETVTFTVTKETPGSYTVSIGDLTEEFTVAAPSWLNRYWWTIVVGIVAVVLLAYFLRRKRAT
jgi:hypothetical protein